MTSRNVPMYLFTPVNRDFPEMIVASAVRERHVNVLAVVEPLPTHPNSKLPRGNVVRYLGLCGDPEAERSAIHYAYAPYYWKRFPDVVDPPQDIEILDVPTINIDPPGCVDIDDCISIWLEEQVIKVAITIADVAAWVKANPWMLSAYKIGQTLYDNGTIVRKLFPHEYRMSLIPGERRLGYALIFDWIEDTPTNMCFKEVTILNKASYTYDNIHDATDFPIVALRQICETIGKKKMPDSHDWVETLMIFYNKTMANCLAEAGIGLLRKHSEPDIEKLELYGRLGIQTKELAYSAATYEYSSTKSTHWGIGGVYTHGTSPIRRFADVVNQLAMKHVVINDCKDELNKLQTYGKKHSRDLAFLEILSSKTSDIPGIVVSSSRIWMSAWNRFITCKNSLGEGTHVKVNYFLDMNQPTWKRRMVFRIDE